VISTAWEAGLDQVVAVAIPGNAPSRRVMEKLGMQFEGPTRYRDLDGVRYSILRPA
jgi:RimJ/RimL family protein N-acetyltransferase